MISVRLSAALVTVLLTTAPTLAQDADTAEKIVDTMNTLWGKHPGVRANHAKGVVVEGSFTSTSAASGLSSAVMFAGKPVPVTVRFSNSTGIPTLPDGSPDANPHGMSIKFQPTDGDTLDVVANSLAFFPVATGEDFLALLQAFAASGPDAPKPTKAEQFISTHPGVLKAVGSVSTPTSFARETYNGIDAFIFVNAAGSSSRSGSSSSRSPGIDIWRGRGCDEGTRFPGDELPHRVVKETVAFRVMAQLAKPGDQTLTRARRGRRIVRRSIWGRSR